MNKFVLSCHVALVTLAVLATIQGHHDKPKTKDLDKFKLPKVASDSDSDEMKSLGENASHEFFQRDNRCIKKNSLDLRKKEQPKKRKVPVLSWIENGRSCQCVGKRWKRCQFEGVYPLSTAASNVYRESTTAYNGDQGSTDTATERYGSSDGYPGSTEGTTEDATEDATSVSIFGRKLMF